MFVLDFMNDTATIEAAFSDYYRTKILPTSLLSSATIAIRNLSALGWLDVLTSDDLPLP